MPHIHKGSPYWWISYTDPSGRRSRESSGTENYKEAAALEARKKFEAYQQQTWGVEPAHTFDELLLAYLQETGTTKKSHERDLYSAAPLTRFFSGKVLGDVSAQDINNYKRQRRMQGVVDHRGKLVKPISDGTIIKELRLLSTAINHARHEWGWKIDNIVSGRVPKKPASKLRWLNKDEYTTLLDKAREGRAKDYLPDFIITAVNTGMRVGELLGLQWSQVDLGQRLIYLDPGSNKTGRHRTVPLNSNAVAALRRQWGRHSTWIFVRVTKKTGEAEKLASIKKSFNSACEAAALSDVTRHTLRHTCAAWMVQSSVPLRDVADVLGHRDIRTTMIYAHLAPENAHRGVAALDNIQCDQIVTTASENTPKTANSS